MRSAILCLATVIALPAQSQGTLTGFVRDASGLGIASAEVRLENAPQSAVTNGAGAFRLSGLPAGLVRVSVRRIGFLPRTGSVTLVDAQTAELTFVLDFAPIQLEQVTVTARREPFDARLAGFRQRSQKKVGTFITRERIEASASATFSDLLRNVPGVRVGALGSGIRNSVRFRGANCAPLVFIDGFPASADEFDVDIVDPSTVEGVEVYMGMLTVPAEFNAPRGLEHCGVIAIWSRPFRPVPRKHKDVSQAELQQMVDSATLYTAKEVDQPARIERDSFTPVYPDSLWKTGTPGQVLVEVVVDRYGRTEMEFFTIVSTSHSAFSASVQEAVARAHFTPAVKGGHRVRQIIQLPIHFNRPKQ